MDCGTSHHRKRRREFIHFYFQIFMGVETSNPTILQYHGIVHGKFSEIFSSSGHRPPPTNSGKTPQKVLSSRPILMKQKPKDRSWSKLSFHEKKFLKKFSTFSKKSKTKFSKKCEFWPEIFFAYESENSKKPKFFDFWYHFGDRPKKLGKIFKHFFSSKFHLF